MNVRLHLLCLVGAALVVPLVMVAFVHVFSDWAAIMFGEWARPGFTVAQIILFMFSPALVVNFASRVPVHCWQDGCQGAAHLVFSGHPFFYVCSSCQAIYNTHFSIGGDD